MRSRILVSLLLALALVAGGCSDDDDGGTQTGGQESRPRDESPTPGSQDDGGDRGSSDAAPDPCDLLTKDDVEEVLGEAVAAGEDSTTTPPFEFHTCTYTAVKAPPVKTIFVQVLSDEDISEELRDGGQSAARQFRDQKEFSEPPAEDLQGLGDEAYRSGTKISILADGVFVTVSTGLGGQSDFGQQSLLELAKRVSARL